MKRYAKALVALAALLALVGKSLADGSVSPDEWAALAPAAAAVVGVWYVPNKTA